MKNDGEGASGRQVIARAAAVLRALADDNGGQSLGEIAKKTGLPRTTVHRIVAALEVQQLAVTSTAGVRLGPALVRLASSAHTDVVAAARPFVEALGRRLRETVDLSVDRVQHAISVDQFASDQELRVVAAVGTAYPLYCTAHGKALLSLRSDDEVATLLSERLERRTPHTQTSRARLIEQLAEIRAQGWALDEEEHAVGICGIGVWLASGGIERYALSVAIPAARFAGNQEAYLSALLQCKAEIESLLTS